MNKIPFLMCRGSRWYYNRAYPLEVQTVLGKAPFRLALRTESLSEAQRARPEAERRYYAEVDAARQRLASQSRAAAITRSMAEALAVQWFLEKLSDDEDWLALPSTPELLDKRLDDASEEIARLRESVALGELRNGCTDALALAERAGVALTGDAVQGFLSLLLRAYIARVEVFRGRLVGDYGIRPRDPFFASALAGQALASPPQPATKPAEAVSAKTLRDLEEAYRADKFAGLSEAARAAYVPVFRLLHDML